MKCKYCRELVSKDIHLYNQYNENEVAHHECYFNFIGSNKLKLDWYETL